MSRPPRSDTEWLLPSHSMTVAGGIRAASKRAPGKPAVKCRSDTVTYAELALRIERLSAAARTTLGLHKGDNVAIVARNCIEYVEVVSALPEAGVAVATVNPRLTSAEIEAICDDARARVIFADAAGADSLSGSTFATVERIVPFGADYEALLRRARAPDEPAAVDERDTWTIPYTSGTTGEPKGVMVSHRSRVLSFYQQALEYGCYSPDDSFLATTPMNHGGLAFPMAAVVNGATVEILDRFDPELLLRKLNRGGFTGVFTVPTQHHAIFDLPRRTLERYRGTGLKAIVSASAPLTQTLKEKIFAYFGNGLLHETYGSTETCIVTNLRPGQQRAKGRSVGTPFAHTWIRLTDDDFNEVAPGEPGELWVKSATTFSGYWNKPDETAAACRDGWVTVGDMARCDEDGFYYIVGRKKDMIISGGVNVYPAEVEHVIAGHPAVAEV
ncbi:MAG: class I adenylate-forming enzyme family protein, partial [Pseudomonadota bacterium]